MKKSKANPAAQAGSELVRASYNAGVASGRLEAIEESMDAVVLLITKAETLAAGLDEGNRAARDSADHTLRALYLAFAAVTGSVNGSAAFRELLQQSRQRLARGAALRH